MATVEQEAPEERRKKTLWLLVAGAASLLIPLAGAIYIHWKDNAGSAGPSGRGDVFERREGAERRMTPSQTAVVLSAPAQSRPASAATGGSSLDFIKGGSDMQGKAAEPKAAAAPPPAPAAAAPPAAPAPAKTAAATAKRPFNAPRLQPTRGFTHLGSSGASGTANGSVPGTAGGQNMQGVLNNLPPGSENNPQVQAYLKSQQGQ